MRLAALLSLLVTTTSFAATYPPHYRWQTITTDHFLIHFHQGEEDLARRAASIAERAHERLVPILGWTPADRTHLILSDHVDVSNGSATPFPNNRTEIYVSAPGADPSSPLEYYDNWLNLVITHEYVHVLHLDQARGFGAAWRRVFGRDLTFGFPNIWSPPWLTEGLATLLESEMTSAGRLKGTFLDMVLRTAAVENQFASVSSAAGLSPDWPSGNTRYFYGAKFLSWLAQREGADKLRQYINEYSGNVIPFRVNATAEDVYGRTINSLWREWSAEQQAAYRQDVDRLGPLTARERVTSLGYETRYPLLSPDGARLAYTHDGPFERPTIRVRDLTTGREIDSHQINNGSAISWSPDGTAVAYSQLEFVGSVALISDIYVWEIGEGERRITRGARLKDPAFLPGGSAVIAVENRAGRNRLVEVNIATGAITPIIEPAGYIQFSEPVVNRTADRIAVAQWENGRIDIVVYDRRGARVANLTRALPPSTNASPRFSDDGTTLYFTSDVTGVANVFAADTAGSAAVRRLTNVYGGAFFPTTRDGRRFYISDYSSSGFDIAMFDAAQEYEVRPRLIPRSVMAAADIPDASSLAIPDPLANAQPQSYSPWQSLRPRWWFPIIATETNASDEVDLTIGATTSGADVLGFHSYSASAAGTFGEGRSDGHFSLVYAYDRLLPTITLGAFRYDEDVVRFVSGDTDLGTYTETTLRLVAQATVPFRRVRHQTYVWGGVIRDDIDASNTSEIVPDEIDLFGIFSGTLQGIRAGAQFNNAQQYAWSISPENGLNVRVDYEHLSRSLGSDASLQQLRGDLRAYRTIPYRRSPLGRHVVAARIAGAQNSGDYVFQRELLVGGSDAVAFPSLDSRLLPVRGFPQGTLRGQRAAIASLEYRFPIWEIERGPSTWPIFFQRVVGAAFVDAGRTWRPTFFSPDRDTIAAAGVEAGLDLFLGFALPLRYKAGAAYRLTEPEKGNIEFFLGLGTTF